MYILYLLLMPLYVYGDNFTYPSMFDTITHAFQFPHEKMGIIMHKHINNHTIVNHNERYLSNSQINMIEIQECGLESDNNIRSYISGVRVNYCFKCSHTSSVLADINSCKYDVVNTSPNNFMTQFHTYTDSSCSTGDIYQFFYNDNLNVCNIYGYKTLYTDNFQYDVSIPGMNKVEYSDTSCSTPFAFEIMGIIKGTCMQISESISMEIVDCTNNNLQYRLYSNSYCGGNGVYQTDQQGTCSIPTSYLVWYEELSSSVTIDYSSERLRSTKYCSSLYSSSPSNSIIIPPTNDDAGYIDIASCDTCPVYHMWEVKCGTFGTANTDIMCSETEDQFTCCSSTGDDCCVANGGTITVFILGIVMAIGACGYKCCGCPTKQQIANMTNSNSSVLDTKIRLTDRSKSPSTDRSKGLSTDSNNLNIKALPLKKKYTPTTSQCGNELIIPTIKPFQKPVQATLSNMEEGIPLAEATIVPVEKPKNKKSKKRNR